MRIGPSTKVLPVTLITCKNNKILKQLNFIIWDNSICHTNSHERTACQQISVIDIYSSSMGYIKKAPKTIKTTTSRYVMNHFSSILQQMTKSSRYCFSCYSNRSFRMIHCTSQSDLSNTDTVLQEWQRETPKAVTSITSHGCYQCVLSS